MYFVNEKQRELNIDTFEKNGKLFYKYEIKRSKRLRSAIIQGNIKDIGKIKEFIREIDPNADRKRLWLGEIDSIDSKVINESVPISKNFLKNTSF